MIKESLKIFIEKTKNLILSPSKFYKDVKNENIGDSFKYFFIASFPLFTEVLVLVSLDLTIRTSQKAFILFLLLFPTSSVILETLLFHICFIILKEHRNIEKTFKVLIYKWAFFSLFFSVIMIIPILDYLGYGEYHYNIFPTLNIVSIFIFFVFSTYILIKGMVILQEMNILKSAIISIFTTFGVLFIGYIFSLCALW